MLILCECTNADFCNIYGIFSFTTWNEFNFSACMVVLKQERAHLRVLAANKRSNLWKAQILNNIENNDLDLT